MSDVMRILDIARRALQAHQNALGTASNNIANVNTEGYSRQRVNLVAARPVITRDGVLGGGVNVQSIERIRSEFVDQQLLAERPFLKQNEFKSDALGFIEDIFGEPSDFGVSRNISDFFNAFNDLANDPESNATRIALREKGVTLANSFNRLNRQLGDYQKQLNNQLSADITSVNQLTAQIANLNQKVIDAEVGGVQAPTLRDERDLLINKLSDLVDVRTTVSDSGAINVAVAGRFLVVNSSAKELKLKVQSDTDPGPVVTFSQGGQVADITKGSIKGILDIRDTNIPEYLTELDQLAVGLAEQVNALHSTGYNLDGITGIDFFVPSVSGAGNFAINPSILSDASLIATSDTTGESGNNVIALALAGLQNDLTMNSGKSSFSDFYGSLIASVGTQAQEADFLTTSSTLIVESLELTRESISGVSLDEEMTNLIEAQQAFTAASRVVSTVDEMMQTILNMV